MGTSTKANVLVHLIYSLLLVIIYLALFEISNGLIGCIFITMIMFPYGMLSTKFNINKIALLNSVLLTEIIQIKNPNKLLKSFHLVMSIIQY